MRLARALASASRFIRSIARRIYSAREIPRVLALRSLAASNSSLSFNEIDRLHHSTNHLTSFLDIPMEYPSVVLRYATMQEKRARCIGC